MIPDLWLYISVVSDLSRRCGRTAPCFPACDYHCRIINEIRSISACEAEPVGFSTRQIKNTYFLSSSEEICFHQGGTHAPQCSVAGIYPCYSLERIFKSILGNV